MAIHNKHPEFSNIDIQRIKTYYELNNLSILEISKLEKCGLKTLKTLFLNHNISIKTKQEIAQQHNQKYWTNENKLKHSLKLKGKKKKDTEYYISKFTKIHGNKYDYSKYQYIHYKLPGIIICHNHGEFYQLTHNHVKGSGCPQCGQNSLIGGYNFKHLEKNPEISKQQSILYIVEIFSNAEEFIKIGITNTKISSRLSGHLNGYKYKILHQKKDTLLNCWNEEQQLLKKFQSNKYYPKIKFNGYTECFDISIKNQLV